MSKFFMTAFHATLQSRCRLVEIATIITVMSFSLIIFPVTSNASDFEYQESNGSITIRNYAGSGGTVHIPSLIDKLPVTTIGSLAFAEKTNITDVVIPETVSCIGFGAFTDCKNMVGITIPDSVSCIGGDAFLSCKKLANVTIPDSVTNIGELAFFNCVELTAINIPSHVKKIAPRTFEACISLAKVTIPEGVTVIGDAAFHACFRLQSVTVPDSVTHIGKSAFESCIALTNVTFGSGVTNIGEAAFRYCKNLTRIVFPDSVTSIGNNAFSECDKLTNIKIPENFNHIGVDVFKFRDSSKQKKPKAKPVLITETVDYQYTTNDGSIEIIRYTGSGGFVKIPSAIAGLPVTCIRALAFDQCDRLKHVTIPASIARIGRNAFSGCRELTNINVDASNPIFCSKDGVLFDKRMSTLIQHPRSKTGSYMIPDGVIRIGESAFIGCLNLTSVKIPTGVKYIEDWAFHNCDNLSSVSLPESVTEIGNYVFFGCDNLTNVMLSKGIKCLGVQPFAYCNIKSITIPSGVTRINGSTFFPCNELEMITVDTSNTNYASIDGVLFNRDITTLIKYPPNRVTSKSLLQRFERFISDPKKKNHFSIPSSVTSIGDYAFVSCAHLTSINVPNSVTNIGAFAFSGCTNLTSLTIPKRVEKIGKSAFKDCLPNAVRDPFGKLSGSTEK